jgi:hypothetical protein
MRGTVGYFGKRHGSAFAPPTAIAVAGALMLAPTGGAMACRNIHDWAAGHDVGKLEPGEFAVRAKVQEAHRDETPINVIAGNPWGMTYVVQVEEVLGGPGAADDQVKGISGKTISIRLLPSTCDPAAAEHLRVGDLKLLVLKKDATGTFELIGSE